MRDTVYFTLPNWEYQIEIMLNDLILILYAVNGKTYTVVKFNFFINKTSSSSSLLC